MRTLAALLAVSTLLLSGCTHRTQRDVATAAVVITAAALFAAASEPEPETYVCSRIPADSFHEERMECVRE
jgi:hypothetical protein